MNHRTIQVTCYNCVKITALYKFYLILRSFEHIMNSGFYKIYKINITNQPDTNITEYYESDCAETRLIGFNNLYS